MTRHCVLPYRPGLHSAGPLFRARTGPRKRAFGKCLGVVSAAHAHADRQHADHDGGDARQDGMATDFSVSAVALTEPICSTVSSDL